LTHAVVVPAYAHDALDEMDGASHHVLLTVDTDVNLEGSHDHQWLIVTRDQVSVIHCCTNPQESESTGRCLLRLNWEEVLEFRTRAGVGSGLLQARTAEGWVDLLRFSNALASRFHKVSRKLEKLRESGDQGDWNAESTLDPPRCHGCGLRLEHAQDDCPRCLQKGRIMRRVGDMLRPHLRGALILCGLTVVGVCAELIPPKLQQYMVDEILGQRAGVAVPVDFSTALLVVVLSLMATRLVLSAVAVIKGRVATMIGTGLTTSLREQMVQKLQQLAVVYYDRHQVGSTLSRVAHDSEVLHGLMHQLTGGFLLQMVQLVGVGAMLLWLNPKLAMYTLIPVPLVFLGSWIFWQKVYPKHFRLRDASAKQWSVLNGMLSGIRVVKAFAQEDREYERFQRANNHLRQWRLWVDFTNDRYAAAMSLVFSMGGLIVWYVGGRDVIGSEMTLGQLIAFLAYLAMFYAPLSALSNFTTWLTSFLSGSKRVLELLDAPTTIPESHNPQPWEDVKGEVVFDQVTFGYDRNQPVLQDISFKIRPGEMIGIVGRSGSGKTTMVNLLGRFYDVQEGCILIDGIDVRNLSSHQLRERLGIVFQDSFLFRGTIWKNLSYGRPQATIAQCLEAAKASGAHDFICRQQLAYETLLGEHGAGLSGGERQRLSIARTLLYDPKVLILDEATSNIDAESERSIQKALDRLVKGRTTLAIAHRLSTLRNADRIFVFDKGKIAEFGSHEELLASDGIYARMVRIQTQVTKTPQVDHLLAAIEAGTPGTNPAKETAVLDQDSSNEADSNVDSSSNQQDETRICWLAPQTVKFSSGQYGQLTATHSEQYGSPAVSGIFVVRAFPTSHSEQYLSVRGWTEKGDEVEVGIIRDLADWSVEEQALLRQSLRKRYLLRKIQRVLKVDLRHGFLECKVVTDSGPQEFLLRWSAGQAIDYGDDGKLLIDTEENRYLVESVAKLLPVDRERFEQYIYW
jgi:ATP-binding cassette, subfamily B, bacterial